jgi:hypothetical protein
MAILYIITGSLKSPSKRYLQETSADERGLVTWLKKRLEVFTHDENGKAENLHWPDLVLPILLWALSIVATELEIEWNNFQRLDILSALGQIIPFAIGASFFIRACLFRFGILESEKDAEEATEKKTGRLKKKVKGKLIKKAEAVKREEEDAKRKDNELSAIGRAVNPAAREAQVYSIAPRALEEGRGWPLRWVLQ